jgi:hypothetical protein
MQQLVKTDEQTNTDGKEIFEKIVSEISKELVTRKQNLPKIVSHPHIQLQTVFIFLSLYINN